MNLDGTLDVLGCPPDELTEWVNRDGVAHDVVSEQFNDGATSWDVGSDRIGNGETTTYTFQEAGTDESYCSAHGKSGMCGVVPVGDASRVAPL